MSPTNEGLYLLSVLIARDFGLLGSHRLATLWEQNLLNLQRLVTLNGHFFNWYDTQTLQPLTPRYVSTVDSGNLAACLLTMHGGIQELLQKPVVREENVDGIRDTLDLLHAACEQVGANDPAVVRSFAQQLLAAGDNVAVELPAEVRRSAELAASDDSARAASHAFTDCLPLAAE